MHHGLLGLIVEGPTDGAVLEALVGARCPHASLAVLQPKRDRTSGWSGVKEYLERKGRDLGNLLRFGGFCSVLVQADADIVGSRCQSRDAAQQWRLAETRLLEWSGSGSWPSGVYPVIPVMCLETWICASQGDCRNRRPQMECFSCEEIVNSMREAEMRNAMEQKVTHFYRDRFAPALAGNWKQVVQFCPEGAGRFAEVLTAVSEACCPKEEA